MADPNAAADIDPFGQLDSSAPLSPISKPKAPAADPFGALDSSEPLNAAEGSSTTGAFVRGAAKGALPALGSLPAMGVGAELGAAAGAPLAPFTLGLSIPGGALLGGAIAGIGASYAIGKAQDYALKQLPNAWQDKLGVSERQQQLDESEHPVASFLGGIAPYALTMRPGATPKVALPANATALQRIMANPYTARAFGGAAMGGIQLSEEKVSDEGQGINWNRVAVATGFGLVFNRPTRIGERITNLGVAQTRRALGLPAQEGVAPTVNQAADTKVAGPGITEPVFQGAHAQDPAAEMTAQQAAREEQSILAPEQALPDLHATARRMHVDLFDRYDELQRQRDIFATEPAQPAHLAEVKEELAELEPQIAAANRRAAEAIGTPIVEPPGAPERFPSMAAMLAAHETRGAPAATPGAPEAIPEKPAAAFTGHPSAEVGVGASEGAPLPQPVPTRSKEVMPIDGEPAQPAENQTIVAPPQPENAAGAPVRSIEQQRDFIRQDVARQLEATGRSPEEAQAAGALAAARYEARAARFKGALGSAEDLYRREGAEIRPFGARGKVRPEAPPEESAQAASQNIDATKDVVSGANSSKDPEGPVQIDKRIPRLSPTLKDRDGNPVNIWNSLQLHERIEGDEMRRWKEYFQQTRGREPTKAETDLHYDNIAHPMANAAEKKLAEEAGYDFAAYTHEMDGLLAHIEHEHVENPPTDVHIDPEEAIGHHRSKNTQPTSIHLGNISAFEKSGMIENAEAYRQAAKDRRERNGGSSVKVYTSAEARARANGTSVRQENAARAKLEAEHGPAFDAALATMHEIPIDPKDVPKEIRAAALDLIVNQHMPADEALDYAFAKAELEANHFENEQSRLAAEGIIRHEEGHGIDVAEIPFDPGEHLARPGEANQEREAALGAPGHGTGARRARFPEEVEFFQRRGKDKDLIAEREAEGQQQIPGMDRISQAVLVQKRADQALKPSVAQKPVDEGLFAPKEGKQGELFQTRAETPEFKQWFGESKVVDAEGHPLIVYHGTKSDLGAGFDIRRAGASDAGVVGKAFYFTPSPEQAGHFAESPHYGRGEAPNIVPSYIKLERPAIIEDGKLPDGRTLSEAHAQGLSAKSGADLQKTLKRAGYDGVIFKLGGEISQIAAFDAGQIRSAYDKEFFQRGTRQGSIVLNPEGTPGRDYLGAEGVKPILRIAKTADASTFIHESGHQYLGELMRDAAHEAAPDDLKADAKTVLDYLGVDSPDAIRTKQHEKFARSFEQYVREGVAPSKELASVFAKFRDWLLRIYQTLRGLGTEITPEIRGVFDRLLAAEPQPTVIAPERARPPTMATVWEADAAHTEPHEAEPAGERILKEAEQYASQLPGHIANEHAASEAAKAAAEQAAGAAAAAGEPGGQAGAGAEPEAAVREPGGGSEPLPAGGAGGQATPAGLQRGGNAVPEGAAKPGSGERPGLAGNADAGLGDKPLAPRPKPDLSATEESRFTDKAGNIRIENLTTREDVAQAIREAASENQDFIGDRRGVVTDGQVEALAEDIGMVGAEKMLRERVTGQAFNAEQIMAARKLLVQSATDVAAAMKRAATGTDEDVLAYAQAKDRHQMIQAQIAGITAEAGRALRAFRNISGGMTAEAKAADQILRDATGKTLFQLRQEARLGAELKTPQQISKFMQDAQYKNFGRMVLEYWINGLISGPVTHMTYAIGNEILTLQKAVFETGTAAAIGNLRRAMGREGDTVRMGEIGAKLRAHGRSIAPAAKAALDALRTGQTTLLPGEGAAQNVLQFPGATAVTPALYDEAAQLSDVLTSAYGVMRGIKDGFKAGGGIAGDPYFRIQPSLGGAIPDIGVGSVNIPIGNVIRAPGRVVAAIHSFFRGVNYSMEKAGDAFRVASNEGHTGTAFDQRMADLLTNPSQQKMEQYAHASSETTLMGQGGAFTQNLSKLLNTPFMAKKDANGNIIAGTGFPILKFIDPFVHISSNIIQQAIVERTPLGILQREIRADLSGKNGTVAQDMATAKMLLGSAYAIVIGGLAAEGYVSGSEPSDPRQAAIWRLAGNQAHSVRIGDMWYDVHRLGPMGMLMGIAADLYDVAHDATQGDMLTAAAHLQHAITQNILDESFMRGPSDLIRAVDDPGRYGEAYLKNFASSFVPFSVGLAQMARAADPYSRQARDVMDSIKAKVPGMSEQLLPRRDVWGEPLPNKTALATSALTAIYESRISRDPVNMAMFNLGVYPGPLARKIRNVELTDQQYDDFQRIAGRMAKQRLDVIVNSPDFRTWPNHLRHDVMLEVITQSREAARGMMMMKNPQIVQDATQRKLDRVNGVGASAR